MKNESKKTKAARIILALIDIALYKYYTADLKTLEGETLQKSSITVKVYKWIRPPEALDCINAYLYADDKGSHKVYNFRRIT